MREDGACCAVGAAWGVVACVALRGVTWAAGPRCGAHREGVGVRGSPLWVPFALLWIMHHDARKSHTRISRRMPVGWGGGKKRPPLKHE